ncbi:MAG: CBS domain-containing protein [Gammaproteobacteria bacterium]|nr:CBS domain-containing protein [Gammaproteobacteria bacterium]MBT8111759.1 CBS domain-containing protein [Gammaproteobacteria bacterium]NND47157.1 CBS domain-containing protein [Woeseiaceae bacterium]NNL46458.1 CBS domain-containing protein [Woeseiaceae bacterium]
MRDTSIDRIMTTNPVMIGPEDSAAKARELLQTSAIHHLPVIDAGKLVGIVSSADLLKLYVLDEEVALSSLATVSQIMELNPVVLATTATLRDAAEKLMNGGFHALPVVDDDRNLVGIVTSVDLIDYLLKSLPVGDGSIVEAPEHSLPDLIEGNRLMQQVCDAAELYVRSGHAEHEHSVLIKCLAAVRDRKAPVDV